MVSLLKFYTTLFATTDRIELLRVLVKFEAFFRCCIKGKLCKFKLIYFSSLASIITQTQEG
jgi:hypothetical protein